MSPSRLRTVPINLKARNPKTLSPILTGSSEFVCLLKGVEDGTVPHPDGPLRPARPARIGVLRVSVTGQQLLDGVGGRWAGRQK
jgi:hypothetical protein